MENLLPGEFSISGALDSLLNTSTQAIGQRLQKEIAGDTFGQDQELGIAEGSGKPFAPGKASFLSGSIAGVPAPLVLVGVGILALAFFLHSKG